MNWPTMRFEQLYAEPSRNGVYKQTQFHGSGVRIVNMGELFAYDIISNQEMNRLSMNDSEMAKSGLQDGDLLFGRRSLVEAGAGKCSLVENLSEPTTFESSIIRVRVDENRLRPRFIFYWLKSHFGRGAIRAIVTGTNVKGIKSSVLKDIEVPCPTTETQDRIVELLRAYDDQIENNRRRIQLLEQAARLLYREWFVHLRFPGHEHVKIKDGVPEGWEKKPLGELLTLQRGFDLPANDREEGPYPIYASTGINGFHKMAKVVGPGIVTGRSGSLGTVMYVPRDFWPLNTALWVKEFKRVSPLFALHLLSGMKLEQYNGGAAVPTLNRNDVHRVETLCPSRNIMRLFDDCINPLYLQIETLERSIKLLAQARDLLLPRLMDGDFGYEQR